MQRNNLPAPTTYIDDYLHDICLSLRDLVDLMTPAAPPEPAAVTELREPAPKMTTRDALQAADASASSATGAVSEPVELTGAQPAPATKAAAVASRRHPKAN